MIADSFVAVLNMGITSACMIAALLLLRPLLVRLPRSFSFVLWLGVLLRLLCPASITTGLSLWGVAGKAVSEPLAVLEQSPAAAVASSMQWAAPSGGMASNLNSVLSAVWLVGVAVMLARQLCSLIALQRRLSGSQKLVGNIYICDSIGSGLVVGLLSPRIYLPAGLENSRMKMMAEHERVHIKRLDYLTRPLAFAALALHWYNPLVWLFVRFFCRDMEISCDEQVIKKLGAGARPGYSRLLLETAAASQSAVEAVSFGKNDIKSRITNVLKFKIPAKRYIVASAVLCAVLLAVLLTNPPIVRVDTEAPTVPAAPSISVEPTVSSSSATSGIAEPTVSSSSAPSDIAEPAVSSSSAPSDIAEPAVVQISFIWPVDGGNKIAGLNGYKGHTGFDIAAPKGTSIYAAQSGMVLYASNQSTWPYGKRVDIDHGDGWVTRYAHCSEVLVQEGDEVSQGEKIAEVGNTGNASGHQLHFEVRYDNNVQNPENYIGSEPPKSNGVVE